MQASQRHTQFAETALHQPDHGSGAADEILQHCGILRQVALQNFASDVTAFACPVACWFDQYMNAMQLQAYSQRIDFLTEHHTVPASITVKQIQRSRVTAIGQCAQYADDRGDADAPGDERQAGGVGIPVGAECAVWAVDIDPLAGLQRTDRR